MPKRAHKGQRGFVFDLSAACIAAVRCDRPLGPLFVSLCRGRRKTTSEGVRVDDEGRADFATPLAGMMVTLWKDKKKPMFDAKDYKFKLHEASDGQVSTVGSVVVDLAQFLRVETTSSPTLQLVMETRGGVEEAALMVDLTWSLHKEGGPDDDDVISTQSAEEEVEDDGPEDLDSSYNLPDDDDESDDEEAGGIPMRFAVFLQEDGEEELVVAAQPAWTMARVRDAVSEQMEGRGLWVFLSRAGEPLDPEEEDAVGVAELSLHQADGEEQAEDGDDSDDGEEEATESEELRQCRRSEQQLQEQVRSLQRVLEQMEDGGEATAVLRGEIEQLRRENAAALSERQAELDQKTDQYQQAIEIGQDLVEKQRELQEELEQAKEAGEQTGAQLEPLQTEIAQLKDIVADHEDNAALIEEERQGMEEQRYRIRELESVKEMLEQELRDKDDAFEAKLERELDEQKATLETKHEADIKWEQQKTEKALESARQAAAESSKQDASDVEALKGKIADLEAERDSFAEQLRLEQSQAGAHKNEIKKTQAVTGELRKEKKELLEKVESLREAAKKAEQAQAESVAKRREQDQKNTQLKKELQLERAQLVSKTREFESAMMNSPRTPGGSRQGGGSSQGGGGLLDVASLADMQAQVAAEYKAKYDAALSAQKNKLKQQAKAHETELVAAEKRGASTAMKKMTKAMRQAKIAQEKEAARAAERAERQHKKELRQAKAAAAKAAGPAKPAVQEGWLQKKGAKGIKGIKGKGGKGWSWRWFRYSPADHVLLYYHKEGPKMDLRGTIDLANAKRIYVLDNKDQDKARQSFGIEMNNSKRTYLLQGGDRRQMAKWVDFLNAAHRKWQGDAASPAGSAVPAAEEGVPPEMDLAMATAQANALLSKMASDGADTGADAEAMSDQLVSVGSSALRAGGGVDHDAVAEVARLALELDASNMEAGGLLKKAQLGIKQAGEAAASEAPEDGGPS